MYKNDKSFGTYSGGKSMNERRYENKSTTLGYVPDLIKKYMKLESLNAIDQYNIFKLDGLIKEKYCTYSGDEAKMNQLRKFYDNILSISETYDSMGNSGDEKLIRLVPIAKYAHARGLIQKDLLKLIDTGVNIVCSEKDVEKKKQSLNRFKNVMEAVIAYSKKEKRW